MASRYPSVRSLLVLCTLALLALPLAAQASTSVVLSTTGAIRSTGSAFPIVAKAKDTAGQPLARATLHLRVTSGPSAGFARDVVTDDAGTASLAFTGSAAGTDILDAVAPDGSVSNALTLQWTAVQACPSSAAGGAPAVSALVYLGPTTADATDALTVAARASDAAGAAIANRTVTFTLGAQSAAAQTDANGVARATLTPAVPGAATLAADLAGDAAYAAAHLAQPLTVIKDETLVVLGRNTAFAAGASESVSATLLDGIDHAPRPLAGKTLTFEIAGTVATATTGADGVAHATIALPAAILGPATLKVSFAGDDVYFPSQAQVAATLYAPSGFVVWGGNAGGLTVGQHVNFWGHSWADQVTGGAYDTNAGFKGWSASPATALCQQSATASTLTPGCWSVKDGESTPPAALPLYIGVTVSTAIGKSVSDVYGNVAALAVVKVDADPAYGNDPGKPGFGTLVAIVADSGVFPEPSLTASIQQPAAVLPGESYDAVVTAANGGNAVAHAVSVIAAFDGTTPASGSAALADVAAGASVTTRFTESTAVPSLRGATESVDAYATRLAALDGRALTSAVTIDYSDAAGFAHPPAGATAATTLRLPRLAAGISGALCLSPGQTQSYAITIANLGSASAASATLVFRTPDGNSSTTALGELLPGASKSVPLAWVVPQLAPKAAGESDAAYAARLAAADGTLLNGTATVTWTDARGTAYGDVVAVHTATERIPNLAVAATVAATLVPGSTAAVSTTVTNKGSGNAIETDEGVANPDGTTGNVAPFTLEATKAVTNATTWLLPAIAPKGTSESDAAYRARLAAADNLALPFTASAVWTDAGDSRYGAISATATSLQILPNLRLDLTGPANAISGDTLTYHATLTNEGHAAAAAVALVATLPDGTTRTLPVAPLAAGASVDVTFAYAVPRTQPDSTVAASAQLRWNDANGNAYGPLSASVSTIVVKPNEPPVVDAGPDQSITLPAGATLAGSVTDDGKPKGAALTIQWSQLSGPGSVTFANAASPATTATFSAPGTYVLRLTANDSELSASDDVTITVIKANEAPLVNAGPDLSIFSNQTATLAGSYTDDGLPAGATPIVTWSVVSGPGTVTFADAASPATTATFSAAGTYVLRLTVSDTQLSGSDDAVVAVANPNKAPVVDAGPDATVRLPNAVVLGGSVTDDGLPAPPALTIAWSKISGPGNVTFANAGAAATSATFDAPGDYTLRLSATDGELSASDDVVVHAALVTLTLAPASAGPNVTGTTQTMTATLRDNANNPLTGESVTFTVTGANAQSASAATNAQGVATFTYTGAQNGSDSIVARSGSGALLVQSNTSTVAWVTPLQKVSTTTILGRFYTAPNVGNFTATPDMQPVFSKNLPTINFNPPSGTVPGNTSGVNEFTRPMYDVTTDLNGNFTGTIRMQGNGAALGNGYMSNFNAVFTGTFTIAAAGPVTFNFYSDDGFIFGIGNGATRVSGALLNPPSTMRTPFQSYPVMGSYNTATAPVANSVTVNFPAAGSYPYELDYSECCQGQLAITMTTSTPQGNRGVPPSGSLVLSPNSFATQPVGSTQTLTVTATDASGIALAGLAVNLNVTGANAQVLSGTTDASGRLSFSYTGVKSGGDTLQATAPIGATVAYSNVVGIDRGTNTAPVANAGPDQTITLPVNGVTLNGTYTDDGSPVNNTLTYNWQQALGPSVVMSNNNALTNTITFTQAGSYIFRLVVSDGQFTATDDVAVTVNPDPNANKAPVVNAGPDQSITLPATATLGGTVTDDGKPAGAVVSVSWSKVNGPGTVTFSPANAAATVASFSAAGTYTLRLTASDTQLSASDDVIVTVGAANVAPTVNAGPDKSITLPTTSVALSGSVTDDGKPNNTLTISWTMVSGPASVTFNPANAAATTATFTKDGVYTLRLSASDGQYTSTDDVVVTVNPDVNLAPVVNAGPDRTIELPTNSVALAASVTDDGKPNNTLTISWTMVSGPAPVTFNPANAAATTVAVTTAGTYVLRLTGNDGALGASDDMTLTVLPPNQAPVVNAGPDQTVTLPAFGNLSGSATDDGLPPNAALTYAWSKVSGPGTVIFANAAAAATQVSFSAAGTYTLRLSVSDTLATGTDDIVVTVLPPPPPPTVSITSPADGTDVTAPADVTGTVSNGTWKLEASLNNADGSASQAWTTIATGSGAVTGGTLGRLDPSVLLNGIYSLRLTATDALGQSGSTSISVSVSGDLKLGNFSLSFNDLVVPMTGLPLQVTRTYDTRNKAKGDFGIGWTLGLRNVRLEKSGQIGNSWEMTVTNGFIPNYCVQPTRPHVITITFPNGKVYKFQARVAPSCQQAAPVEFTTVSYAQVQSVPGTQGASLIAVGADDDVEVVGSIPGTVQLIDLSSVDVYNPTVFRLTTAEGYQYTIDQSFGATQIVDPNGSVLTINSSGVSHSAGKSVVFTRDGAGRITRITDPAGAFLQYTYDANGDLVKFTDRDNNVTTFTYDAAHHMLTLTDPRGKQLVGIGYDASGRMVQQTDANGGGITFNNGVDSRSESLTNATGDQTSVTYDDRGNLLTETDAAGGTKTYTYDARGNRLTVRDALGKTTTYTYDAQDHRTSTTDPLGNVTAATFDAQGNPLTQTDAKGNVSTNTYDAKGNLLTSKDPLGNVTTYGYDFYGHRTSVTTPMGCTTTYEYDGNGNVTKVTDGLGHAVTYTYDANNNRLTETKTRTVNGAAETLTTTMTYDKSGHPLTVTYPDGAVERTEYDGSGQKTKLTDALGHVTTYTYDDAGHLVRTTFADASTETATYDADGRVSTKTDRDGRTTTLGYDQVGRPNRTTFADGSAKATAFDAAGRVHTVTNERGGVTTTDYDDAGRVSKVTDALGHSTSFTYDKNGNKLTATDANGRVTTYAYDANNRLTKETYADGTFKQIVYDADGRKAQEIDPAGATTTFTYDCANRLVKVTDNAGGVTAYAYDEIGEKLSETNAEGHATAFAYDKRGRQVKKTLPLGQSTTVVDDANGNVTSSTDANGVTTTVTYDVCDRLVHQSAPDGAVDATYTAAGLRKTVTDARGTTTWTYDNRGRVSSVTEPDGRVLSYTYDASSNRASVTTPAGTTTYTYDLANRLTQVAGADGTATYGYDAAGNRISLANGNGTTTSYAYDLRYRLTDLVNKRADGTVITGHHYTLGAAGNRLRVTEDGGRVVDYAYDGLYRLTSETASDPAGNSAISYTYDRAGNRLTKTENGGTTMYTYDANDRLLSEGATTYAYDNDGNLTSRIDASGQTLYVYDSQNRLVRITAPSGITQYAYDADGNRVQKSSGGAVSNYLVDRAVRFARVLVESDGAGAIRASFTYGDDLLSMRRGATPSYYHFDGQFSTRALTNALGQATDHYTYSAFGILQHKDGSTVNDFLYTGQQFDPNAGFYYLRARYYDPATGRFLTSDTFAGNPFEPMSLHKYLYTSQNPANMVDFSGHEESLAELNAAVGISEILDQYGFTLLRLLNVAVGVDVFYRPGFAMRNGALDLISGLNLGPNGLRRALEMYERGNELIEIGSRFITEVDKAIQLVEGVKHIAQFGLSLRELAEAFENVPTYSSYVSVSHTVSESFFELHSTGTSLFMRSMSYRTTTIYVLLHDWQDWSDVLGRAIKAALEAPGAVRGARELYDHIFSDEATD